MYKREGIPFFIIIIPFISIIFLSAFSLSYNLKIEQEQLQTNLTKYQILYKSKKIDANTYFELENEIKENTNNKIKEFEEFIYISTVVILISILLFSILMKIIINEVVKKYKLKVEKREEELKELNKTLLSKVQLGIEQAKKKDKAILSQARLARLGSMLSMIAHQWRQPLSELSAVLMEQEMAIRMNKSKKEEILISIERSNNLIEFMSNTIDDFRNFYKPDKVKENFFVSSACESAIDIVDATLKNLNINLILEIKKDKEVYGYKREYSQVILNLITNAKDILIERKIQKPNIIICIDGSSLLSIVTIKDNGGGVDENNFENIFDPYFTSKDSSKGTGLGLYISKLIIEKNMGGELNVENSKYGAMFTVIIRGKI